MPDAKVQTKPPRTREASTAATPEKGVGAPIARASILLIEDEESLRSVVSRTLSLEGYRVIEATNGREGVDHFRRTSPDLVITDIWMPDTDGLEATLQMTHDFPEIKIIAITGGSGDRDCLGVARFFGARRTLRKPFEIPELLKTVRELLAETTRPERSGRKPRVYPRFAMRCPAAFSTDGVKGMGNLVNLSQGGCAVESVVNLPTGSYATLEIYLPTGGSPLAVDLARVQWNTGFEFGMAFIRIAPPSQHALQDFLAGLQKEASRQDRQ